MEADCVVGTGRVAIEAIACKKPVFAAGNNGYFGLLNCDNIENAWRVYFGDHKSLKSNNASFLYHTRLCLSKLFSKAFKDHNYAYISFVLFFKCRPAIKSFRI